MAVMQDLVRCHGGILFVFQDGAFRPYSGVMPECVLATCRKCLLRLEGIFRIMSAGEAPNNDSAILNQLKTWYQVFTDGDSHALVECEDAAIT